MSCPQIKPYRRRRLPSGGLDPVSKIFLGLPTGANPRVQTALVIFSIDQTVPLFLPAAPPTRILASPGTMKEPRLAGRSSVMSNCIEFIETRAKISGQYMERNSISQQTTPHTGVARLARLTPKAWTAETRNRRGLSRCPGRPGSKKKGSVVVSVFVFTASVVPNQRQHRQADAQHAPVRHQLSPGGCS